MTDVAHTHAHDRAKARAAPSRVRPPALLAMSVGARLLLVAPVLAALWAGVYWALN